jgi:hypothetical protein
MSQHRTKQSVEAGIMSRGACALDYQPGNGTRYEVVMTPIADKTSASVLGASLGSVLFTFPLWGKCIVLPKEEDVFARWVAEKLQIGPVDANALAELFAYLLGAEAVLGGMG